MAAEKGSHPEERGGLPASDHRGGRGGGLAAAGQLARLGFRVWVLEKNPEPSGWCGRLEREGHRFDTGPTLLLMPEVFEQTYAAL